jgi:2-phosphosulfolactate phosphatase
VLVGSVRNAPAVTRHLEESDADSIYLVCAGSGGRFTVEDFIGAAEILARMNTDGWRINDAAWLALDFVDRHEGVLREALLRGRAGRWFAENDRMDAFDFVAAVGASETVPEVVRGRLVRAGEPEESPPPKVSEAE